MTDHPQTWHYGLVARWWAEFNVDGPEIDFFQTLVEQYGQPALDIACGTGRLLIPFLRAGLDVDGCDISSDMLALCRQRAQEENLEPRLYPQAMHELDLPRKYKSIVVCGAFGIGGSRVNDQKALNRMFAHLEPGGVLMIDNYLPYKNAKLWRYWLREERVKLPQAWPSTGNRKVAKNGEEIELKSRLAAFDPLDQVATRQIRVILWREGQAVEQEEYTLLERLYFRDEILAMLALAEFRNVDVLGGYTKEPATPDSDILVFVARK